VESPRLEPQAELEDNRPANSQENREERQEVGFNADEDQHNEPEYTNGQASSRELNIRNNLLRRFYESESGASSPFSVNPSEPSVPNTPRSFGSDSSNLETP